MKSIKLCPRFLVFKIKPFFFPGDETEKKSSQRLRCLGICQYRRKGKVLCLWVILISINYSSTVCEVAYEVEI